MAESETRGDRGGVLAGLLAPVRIPERVLDALETIAAAATDVRPIRSDVAQMRVDVAEIGEQADVLSELLPALERLEQRLGARLDAVHEVAATLERVESSLDATVKQLVQEIGAMHETMSGLKLDVRRVTDRMPDPEDRGPLEKARDALTGGGD